MTGLKAEKVIGRSIREIMPNIEQSWIDRYGKVALTGEPTSFQSYTRELDKSFEVAVFQPAPNQFACLFEDVTQRMVYEESLAKHRSRLQSLAAQMANTEDLLRQDIAAGLHDSIGQDLAALKLTVDMMRKQKDPTGVDPGKAIRTTLDDISDSLDGVVQKIWNLAFQLSPPGLYEAGLVPALDWLVEQFNELHEVKFTLRVHDRPPELEKKVRGLLFQTTRELLTNAVKHASPTEVTVDLSVQDDRFLAVITDNGRGFDPGAALAPEEVKGGFGLFSIRERLAFLGGNLEIKSAAGSGARISILLPLNQLEFQKAELGNE
jgi:signal transduction histidine kinase